jgi:molybdopterin converting factor small subunit
MKVAIRYMAQLRHAAGAAGEQVEVDPPCSVRECLARLAGRRGGPLRRLLLDAAGGLQPTLLVFVGDEQVASGDRRELRDGDVVTVLTPMAGG